MAYENNGWRLSAASTKRRQRNEARKGWRRMDNGGSEKAKKRFSGGNLISENIEAAARAWRWRSAKSLAASATET